MAKGRLFILSGPSGVGKGTVRARLFEKLPDLVYSISCTTRKPREGEKDGIQYRFINEETFESYIQKGLFLEWAQVHDHLYGTLKSDVERELNRGNSVVLEIDVQGALQVRGKIKDSVMIFILPPSMEELKRRLTRRGTEEEESLLTRLHNASEELSLSCQYDYAVVNDRVERAAAELTEILKKEIRKTEGSDPR